MPNFTLLRSTVVLAMIIGTTVVTIAGPGRGGSSAPAGKGDQASKEPATVAAEWIRKFDRDGSQSLDQAELAVALAASQKERSMRGQPGGDQTTDGRRGSNSGESEVRRGGKRRGSSDDAPGRGGRRVRDASATSNEPMRVSIMAVNDCEVSFVDEPSRRARGRQNPQRVSMPVAKDVHVTTAQVERRTGTFRVGAELNGGLQNAIFQNPGGGIDARLIVTSGRITAIHVIKNANQTGDTVRPRRPGG